MNETGNDASTKPPAIRSLEAEGYRVLVSHRRPLAGELEGFDLSWGGDPVPMREWTSHVGLFTRQDLKELGIPGSELSPRGGETIVTVLLGEEEVARGQAQCCLNDNFDKGLGITIAAGRARKVLAEGQKPTV